MAIIIDGTTGITFPDNSTLTASPVTSTTEALTLPVGTTAQRPVSPTNGATRLNSTTNMVEWYAAA